MKGNQTCSANKTTEHRTTWTLLIVRSVTMSPTDGASLMILSVGVLSERGITEVALKLPDPEMDVSDVAFQSAHAGELLGAVRACLRGVVQGGAS